MGVYSLHNFTELFTYDLSIVVHIFYTSLSFALTVKNLFQWKHPC